MTHPFLRITFTAGCVDSISHGNELDLSPLISGYILKPKNPETRKEIEELWAHGDHQELTQRLSKRISFGTAGSSIGSKFTVLQSHHS